MSDETNNESSSNEPSDHLIPVERQGLLSEFKDFIIYNKAWWMTPIIIVLLLMVAVILFTQSSPVLPFIYTVI
jgi:hypothetical protein